MTVTVYRELSIGTVLLALLFVGCETGSNKSVTGDYFDRSPGELTSINAGLDSLTVFRENTGEFSSMFAGKYKNTTAFSVIEFPKPATELLDSLEQATVIIKVSDTWRDGDADFALYETVSTWSDSARLDPDMFTSTGSPIVSFSDTASALDSLEFRLSDEIINNMRSWSGPGSFKVCGTETGKTMVNLYSWNSSSIPSIEYIYRKTAGALDTTTTECLKTNYYFDTGFDSKLHDSKFTVLVADADVRGFKIKLPLPDSLPATASINKCSITFSVSETMVPSGNTFYIGIYQLDEPTETFIDASYESSNSIEQAVVAGMEFFEADITSFVTAWRIKNAANYSILVRPLQTGETPSYIVFSPPDSVSIIYSILPEVE